MLLFGRTHTALVIFIAMQSALCATTLAVFARRLLPPFVASALGLFLILLPAFQAAGSQIMVDVFLTMMELWAMLTMIEFFRSKSLKSAVWFGVVTSLAMLTKGNANDLLLCGVIMLLLTRQFSILKRTPVYVAGMIILLLGMPWQVVTLRLFGSAIPMEPLTPARFWMLSSGYTKIFIDKLSLPLFLFAVVGLIVICLPLVFGRSKEPTAIDAAAAASLLLAIFLFHCVSPNPGPDDRYIVPALPLLLLFAALGIRWLAASIPVTRLSTPIKASVIAVLCLGWFAKTTFALTHRPEMGFKQIGAQLLPARVNDEVVLVCSDTWGEGAFITSMALNDRAGDLHIVLRGSKTLSENPWMVVSYHSYFANPSALESFLEQTPVDAVLVDLSNSLWQQDSVLVQQTLHDNSDKWALISDIPADGARRHLQLYRWIGADHSNVRKDIRVRMRFTLGHDLLLK